MTSGHPVFRKRNRSTIPIYQSHLNRISRLACGALLLAAAALGGAGAVGAAAAQSFQPPIANLPIIDTPIEQMGAEHAQYHLDLIIENNLTALRYYDDHNLCAIFRVFTQTEQLNATEELLNSLARRINRSDPQAGRQAAQNVANYVRRVSALIRGTKCPPELDFDAGTGNTVGPTVPRRAASAQRRIDRVKKQIARTERRAQRYLAAGNCSIYQDIRASLEHRFTTPELAEAARAALAALPAFCDPDEFIRTMMFRDWDPLHGAGDGDAQ